MKKPLVSVIIPNYNYARYLPEAVESVLAQTYENLEVIVVDDGSKDNSAEVLKGFGEKIKVVLQQNAGVSAARNNGVSVSRGEFLAFLDADDVWLPEKIEKQMQRFFEDEELGFVNCGVEEITQTGETLQFYTEGAEGWVARQFLLFKTPVIYPSSTSIVSRKAFDDVGAYDTRLSTSADWDFAYRVALRYKIGLVAEPLAKYRFHGSNMHGNIERMEREMLICYEKAFSAKDAEIQAIRKEAYGNLHQVLASSYFYSGNYRQFVKHTLKSIRLNPKNLAYFANYPFRLLQRKFKNSR